MRQAGRVLLVWIALFGWIVDWGVHAGMLLAQAAGRAQVCSTHEDRAPGAPEHGARFEGACCAQALSTAAPSAAETDRALFQSASADRARTPRVAFSEGTRRAAAHAPRAPPAA